MVNYNDYISICCNKGAEIMNKEYSDLIGLEPLVVPTKVVKSETKKGQEK